MRSWISQWIRGIGTSWISLAHSWAKLMAKWRMMALVSTKLTACSLIRIEVSWSIIQRRGTSSLSSSKECRRTKSNKMRFSNEGATRKNLTRKAYLRISLRCRRMRAIETGALTPVTSCLNSWMREALMLDSCPQMNTLTVIHRRRQAYSTSSGSIQCNRKIDQPWRSSLQRISALHNTKATGRINQASTSNYLVLVICPWSWKLFRNVVRTLKTCLKNCAWRTLWSLCKTSSPTTTIWVETTKLRVIRKLGSLQIQPCSQWGNLKMCRGWTASLRGPEMTAALVKRTLWSSMKTKSMKIKTGKVRVASWTVAVKCRRTRGYSFGSLWLWSLPG